MKCTLIVRLLLQHEWNNLHLTATRIDCLRQNILFHLFNREWEYDMQAVLVLIIVSTPQSTHWAQQESITLPSLHLEQEMDQLGWHRCPSELWVFVVPPPHSLYASV